MLQPPQPLSLRPLRVSDLPEVAVIEELSFPTPVSSKAYRYELTENKLAYYQALTLKPDAGNEILLGYAGYWLMAGEVHISIIAVEPTYRGSGFGELLLLNIITLAYEQVASLVTLEVRESNKVAQKLYEKYQFKVVGKRDRYYRDKGEDAILMTIHLVDNQTYPHFLEQKRKTLFRRLAGGVD